VNDMHAVMCAVVFQTVWSYNRLLVRRFMTFVKSNKAKRSWHGCACDN